MSDHTLFIYGTLQDAEVMQVVIGRTIPLTAQQEGIAPFFKIMKVKHVQYPCLVEGDDSDVADGVVVSGLSAEELQILDRFEGENYHRVAIDVIAKCRLVQTQAYMPCQALETDGPWQLAEWQAHNRAQFLSQDFNLAGVRPPNA